MTSNRRSNLAFPLIALAIVGALLWWWRSSPGDGEPSDPDAEIAPASAGLGANGPVVARPPMGALDLLADPGGSIAGRVTSKDGKPIAGADVCARTQDPELGSAQIREPRCVKSEHDGSYRIERLWRVRWGVSAAARGYIAAGHGQRDPDFEGLRLDRDPEASGIDIELEPGGVEITGVVKDLGGGEIEGAFVSATSGNMYWFDRGGGWGAIARTDADGKFVLWVDEGFVQVAAQADGYTSSAENGKAPGMFFTLVLTPESVLAGVVRDPSGNPVPGARVDAHGEDGEDGTALTDEDGRYRIDKLGPSRYKPRATADGFEGMAKESVRLGIGESLDPVDVIVHPAAIVSATVKIAGAGACPEGSLALADRTTHARHHGTIDDGAVQIPAVHPGHYEIRVQCTGYAAAEEYPDLDVQEDDVTGLVYEVHEGRSIRGVVVDAEGKGVVEATVFAQLKGVGRGTARQAGERPDESGRFQLAGLVAGTYTLDVWSSDHPDLLEPLEVVIPEDGDPEEVRVQLDASGSIRGTVKDAGGKAIAGIDVRARGTGWHFTSVLDDGTFELDGLRAGDYRVTAQGAGWGDQLRKPGAGDDDIQGERVTVVAGEVAEIALVVESREGKIEGTVVDEAGGPLADAYLSVTRESESAAAAAGRAKQQSHWTWGRDSIVSDVDGRFVADGLALGKYTLRAYRKGGGEGFVEGVEVGGSVEIRIEVEGSVSGTVTIDGGGVPERFFVTMRDAKAGVERGEPFERTDGAWALHEIPAGTYDVTVSAPEGSAELKDMTLAAGEEREGVALSLEGRTTIRGRVVALDTGEPVEGVVVTASRRGVGYSFSFGGKPGKEVTAADGTYELENAPSGRLSLFTRPTNFADFDTVGRGSIALQAEAGSVVEAPDILVPPRRVPRGEQPGDLGFSIKQTEPGDDADNPPKVVALVRPGGPAAGTDLEAGDVIVAVDGHDVTGVNTGLYASLADVTAGTAIELGLQRGTTVRITAGPPI